MLFEKENHLLFIITDMRNSYHFTLLIGIVSALFTCQSVESQPNNTIDYRKEMVTFVEKLSTKARSVNPNFLVIAQNAEVLLTQNGAPDGQINERYLNAIDAISKESLLYGLEADNMPTSREVRTYTISFLDLAKERGKTVMAVDYCSAQSKVEDSYELNQDMGYISFAAPERELNVIPRYSGSMIDENSSDINSLSDARNFLYVLNPGLYDRKQDFIEALERTSYDMIVLDWVFYEGLPLSGSDIERLKTKANGGKRLVVTYMSIGEAEDYRYYWKEEWNENLPEWIGEENPNWPGNYPVQYWADGWQKMIYRSDDSYLNKLIQAGYDGVYLDRIDAFYHFEQK